MKRFLILISAVALISCNVQVDKPEIIDEQYNPTDEELFMACSDLQGISQFVIGKTTFKSVLRDKDYRNSSTSFDRESNLYNGHWGCDFWKTDRDNTSSRYDKSLWIENKAKGRIKQLLPWFSGMKIGELEFDKFDMAFLNDTLVAIFFYPDDKIEEEVITHYKNKYGNGRGHYKYYYSRVQVGENITVTQTTDEQRLWANDKVALEYVNDEYFHMEPGKTSTSYFEHSLLLYSKSRYPIFEDLVKRLSRQYDEYKSESRNSSLNSL